MKTSVRHNRGGFTLIEMVGVLAVIAILAALLIPKIFAAINESRLNNAVVSYNSVKSAAMMYFGKYGKFGGVGGTNLLAAEIASPPTGNATNWDAKVLLTEQLVEKPFATKVGSDNTVEIRPCLAAAATVDGSNAGYDLSGAGGGNTAGSGQSVVEAVMKGVALDDARDLSLRIDGPSMTETDATTTDIRGRVKYTVTSGQNTTDVYIYIAHK